MKIFKNKRYKKIICFYLALNLFFEVVSPTMAFALTSGPGQEEFASFEPAGTSDMVDIYTGDFTYNIPLLSIPGPNGGYPINLAYHSGVGMEQEASWVGLGWTLNVGAINRQLRGLPDDFSGESITKTQKMGKTWNASLDIPSAQTDKIAGFPISSAFPQTWQIYYNNYKGLGFKYNYGLSYHWPSNGQNVNAEFGLGLSYDSQGGLGIDPHLSFEGLNKEKTKGIGFEAGLSYNSRHGLQSTSFSTYRIKSTTTCALMDKAKAGAYKNTDSKSKAEKEKQADAQKKIDEIDNNTESQTLRNTSRRSDASFNSTFNVPQTSVETKTTTVPFSLQIGNKPIIFPWEFTSKYPLAWSGYYSQTDVKNNGVKAYPGYGYMHNLDNNSRSVMRDFQRDNIPYSKKVPNLPMSNFTYDLFTQTGQGSGGMFRSFQNGVGVLSDPDVKSTETTVSAHIEVGLQNLSGVGNNFHLGGDAKYGSGYARSGAWSTIGLNPDVPSDFYTLQTSQLSSAHPDYEDNYMQMIGEKAGFYTNSSDDQLYQMTGGAFSSDAALKVKLNKVNDPTFLNRHYQMATSGNNPVLTTHETSSTSNTLGSSAQFKKQPGAGRVKRATNIEKFTYYQGDNQFCYGNRTGNPNTTQQYTYKNYSGSNTGQDTRITTSGTQNTNQIREMSVLQPDGMRYVYGLPVVNKTQVDNVVSVNGCASGATWDINTTEVKSSQIIGSQYTCDGYQSRNEYPSYVNSWLLSYIFSPDYVDRTNDGPTSDDFGYWIKFNYGKYADDYNWRTPYNDNNFMIGSIGDADDDKASYSWGQKEVYFIETVETKTHIALFIKSDRLDGLDAPGEIADHLTSSPNRGTHKLKKLDKIVLYSKKDYNAHISNLSQATPVKTVNFQYSYDLCQNVENNNAAAAIPSGQSNYVDETNTSQTLQNRGGKLTLLKVWFTYQNSGRGALSPYIFNYGIAPNTPYTTGNYDQNPIYNKMNMDRWGDYKNNTGPNSNYSGSNDYPYMMMPYASQDPNDYNPAGCTNSISKLSAAPWTLKKIFLPTGGTIRITYDFDDYAYVEDKPATEMFDVVGVGGVNANYARNGTPTYPSVNGTSINMQQIYFKLRKPLIKGTDDQEFFNQYINNLPSNQVYFKAYVKYDNLMCGTRRDFVAGYGEIDPGNCGIEGTNGNSSNYGYIRLKPMQLANVNITGKWVNPIYRYAIEALHANHPEWLFAVVPNSGSIAAQFQNLIAIIPNFFQDISSMIMGFNNYSDAIHYVNGIRLNGYSVIRLGSPYGKKIGGGSRVKKIELDDNWDNDGLSSTNDKSTYGQEYDYTTKNANGDVISSGVAYEPKVGNEESALKVPINYINSVPMSSSYHMFVETPVGESYYPGASVGYSKVTVKSIGADQSHKDYVTATNDNTTMVYNNCSAGNISVYEFYTPKDFPVLFNQTDKGPYSQPIKCAIPVLGLFTTVKHRHAQTQGYSLILNDMAGKPKTASNFTAKLDPATPTLTDGCGNTHLNLIPDQLISRQEYIYNTTKPYNPNAVNELSSNVQAISVDNNYNLVYQTAVIGQTHDFFIDVNENEHKHQSFGLMGNLDFQMIGIFPFPDFWLMPSYDVTYHNMRTVVANKIITRTGILMKTVNTVQQSTIVNENLAFNIETGEALLSKTTNEFKDPVYSFNFKGHWYYSQLGGSYQNFGVKVINLTSGSLSQHSVITIPSTAANSFTKGDLVYINAGTSSGLYHVFRVGSNGQDLYCIDMNGYFFPPGVTITSIEIVKSGFTNQQDINVGGLVFKQTQRTYNGNTYDFVKYDPQQASSTTKVSPQTIYFTDNTQNKILNASATEYSDNWQTFGGTNLPAQDYCTCSLSQNALDMYNFLNGLAAAGKLLATNEPIYLNGNTGGGTNLSLGTYNYNFCANLIAGSSQLMTVVIPYPTSMDILYSAAVEPTTGDLIIYLHGSLLTFNSSCPTCWWANDAERACAIVLTYPQGMSVSNAQTFWSSIVNFNNISPAPDACLYTANGLNDCVLNVNTTNGAADIGMVGTPVYPTNCGQSCLGLGTVNSCYTFTEHCSHVQTAASSCGFQLNQPLNPYLAGMKGMWRPKYSYKYHGERNQNDNIREDGTFDDFQRFPWENPSTRSKKWVRANTVSKYLPHDFEVENADPLGIFSSALYGYNFTLPVAVAKNARYNEIAFDGFEDYTPTCEDDHCHFASNYGNITTAEAHTGKYSLRVAPGGSNASNVTRDVKTAAQYTGYDAYTVNNTPLIDDSPTAAFSPTYNSQDVAHLLNDNDLLGKFAPIENKKYVFSAWVHQNPITSSTTALATFPDPYVFIGYAGCSQFDYALPTGNIIDGWQRIYLEFTICPGTTQITVYLGNLGSTGQNVYFDDVRIHPFDANMESYVYDPISLKPMAELDANNYATFYNYDDNGHLIKVKFETKEGIKTAKEGRDNTKKVPY